MEQQYSSLREKIAAEKSARHDRYSQFAALYAAADAAGKSAAAGMTPDAMIVSDDPQWTSDPKRYFVAEGVCGFAWVTVRPANSSFAIWSKKNRDWKPAYGGGMQLWVSAYNQSMQRKEAYATAFANVLYAAGIKAYAGSRMD